MSGGAGFLPPTVGDFDSAMQQIHFRFSGVFQAVSSNPSLPKYHCYDVYQTVFEVERHYVIVWVSPLPRMLAPHHQDYYNF